MFQSFDSTSTPQFGRERVNAIRARFDDLGIDGFLVPRADEYQGEYVPKSAERLSWLTGFTGSAGVALVTRSQAIVFVDGRYVTQLAEQVDGSVAHLGNAVAALGGLQARWGSFFVTGNHDYSSGEVEWSLFLERLGIGLLRNRAVSIGDAHGNARMDLLGVDDWSGARRGRRGYDLDAALSGLRDVTAKVLLAHQPANFDEAAERGIDLQVSGHTHGGQIFPMTQFIHFAWDHVAGLYAAPARNGHGIDAQIFVSRGCGFWGPPMRLNAPPEIAKLVLTV